MKKLNLKEDAYKRLKERLINEISYSTVDNAYHKSNSMFSDIRSSFMDFYDAVMHPEYLFNYDGEEYSIEARKYEENPSIMKIKEHAEAIFDILQKKENQQDRFYDETMNKFDYKKFYDSEEGKENDYDDMDLRYLQSKYPKN